MSAITQLNIANFNKYRGASFPKCVNSTEKWYKNINQPLFLLKHLNGSFFHRIQPESPGVFVCSAVLNQQHLIVPICTPPQVTLWHMLLKKSKSSSVPSLRSQPTLPVFICVLKAYSRVGPEASNTPKQAAFLKAEKPSGITFL